MLEALKAFLASIFIVASPAPGPAPQIGGADALAYAVPLIAKWEGKRNTAYLDIVGVPTICYGHTRTVTRADVAAGKTLSDLECTELLHDEVQEYRNRLRPFFTDDTRARRLPPKRDAAYTSLAFNVGVAGAGRSTAVKRLNAGDIAGGCEALTWWNKAGGRVVRGLVNRRAEEYAYCMEGAS